MPRTHGQIVSLMEHGLGRLPDPRHDLWATYNDAGRRLLTAYAWRWASKAATVPVAPAALTTALPTDVGTLRFIGREANTAGQPLILVEPEELEAARRSGVLPSGKQWVAMVGAGTSATFAPTLEWWPQIGPTGFNTVVRYQARWAEVTSAQSAQYPAIDPEWERALVLLARAMAGQVENQTAGLEDELYQAEVRRLIELDARTTPTVDSLVNAVDPYSVHRLRDERVFIAGFNLVAP